MLSSLMGTDEVIDEYKIYNFRLQSKIEMQELTLNADYEK